MFVIRKMRLNTFEPRPMQSNREVAMCKGESAPIIQSKNTAECYNEPSIVGASKTKVLGLAQDISTKAIEHRIKEDSKPLDKGLQNL